MIQPTIGRVVLYTPPTKDPKDAGFQPHAATVAYVWNDRMVNLSIVDSNGVPYSATSVQLLQDDDAAPEGQGYCEWMAYQKTQAAKEETQAA